MVGALGCRFLGIWILICIAQCGRRRHGHHERGIAQESHVEAMDPGIRCLLAMAAELAAAELSVTVFADLPVLMLVHLSVVMPLDIEQRSVLNPILMEDNRLPILAKLRSRAFSIQT